MQYLYVLENTDNGNIKIGVSNNPRRRITILKSQGGFYSNKSKVFGPFHDAFRLEAFLHNHFDKNRYIGEWFKLDFIESITKIEEFASQVPLKKPTREKPKKKKVNYNIHLTKTQKEIMDHIDKNKKYVYVLGGHNKGRRFNIILDLEKKGLIKRVGNDLYDGDLKSMRLTSKQSILKWVKNDEY